jgi:dTDP-4-dehydrorhamnose reductase
LLQETWSRYGLPVAVTEAHIDANREDQMRWLMEIWQAAKQAQQKGADIRAVTVWALLGSFDWNCLVTECKGYYEPGPFDVRSPVPRPTAVASMMRELAGGESLSHPVLQGVGWWRRNGRFYCKPVATSSAPASLYSHIKQADENSIKPILITGANGTLGQAFARICKQRNLPYRLLSRQDMDMAVPESVEHAIALYQPWAVINAAGYVNVDQAESEAERCFRDNTYGPSVLAAMCRKNGIQLLSFSSDLVFDGMQQAPYVESDPVAPLNCYGRSKAAAEKAMLEQHAETLMVRTSAFFGPWDSHNFVTQALKALLEGGTFHAANDIVISPTYVPDLVHACLDLLIDRESGIWHLTNGQALTWADFALTASEMAKVDASRLKPCTSSKLNYAAKRPAYSALTSERALLLPSLDDALARYLHVQKTVDSSHQEQAIRYGGR